MAVQPQKPKSRKKQIEPLDWSTMSQSPALKGMVSFLEVTPEDIRRQQRQNGDSRTGGDASTGSDPSIGIKPAGAFSPPIGGSTAGRDSHRERKTLTDSEPLSSDYMRPNFNSSNSISGPVQSGCESHTGIDSPTGSETGIGSEMYTGPILIKTLAHPTARTLRKAGRSNKEGVAGESSREDETFQVVPSSALAENESPLYGHEHAIREAHTGSDTPTVLIKDGGDSDERQQRAYVTEAHTWSDARTGSATPTGSDTPTGLVKDDGDSDERRQQAYTTDSHTGCDTRTSRESHVGSDTHTSSDTPIGLVKDDGDSDERQQRTYISESHTGSDSHAGSGSHTGSGALAGVRPPDRSEVSPKVNLVPVSDSRIGSSPMNEPRIGGQQKQTYFVGTEQYSRPQRRMAMLQGEVVWQNRKIRKCILAQDAHSQGEDALFSAMWNAAKPEVADPSGSRTLRIGYAELAQRSRMHRSNIRINIAGLRAKLAIEVLDEHDSRDVMPRLYRLYSYKEILERRRAAGLEYVIRKKSVVFVTETGELLALPGLPKTSVRKAQKRSTESNPQNSDGSPAHEARAEQLDLDVRQISEALSQHWPVDEAAAQQLLRQCRSIRRDADIGEIVFFINEKLQIALTNKQIKNPTGLILATVPQCFEGATFEDFRRRRNEALRLAAEEQERKRHQQRDLETWLEGKLHELRAVADDDSQPEAAREKARRELKQYGG